MWWDHELAAAVAGLPTSHDSHRPGPGACREEGSSGESPGHEGPQPGEELGNCSIAHPSLPPDRQPACLPLPSSTLDLSLPTFHSFLLCPRSPFPEGSPLYSPMPVPSSPRGSVRSLRGFPRRRTPFFVLLTPASVIGLPFAIWVPPEASRRT